MPSTKERGPVTSTEARVSAFAQSERRAGDPVNGDAFVVADLDAAPSRDVQQSAELRVGAKGVLVAVADGVSGYAAKDLASRLAVTSLLSSLHSSESDDTAEALDAAFASAHGEIRREAGKPGRHGMSTTLTALVIRPETAYVGAVGDSPVYLSRGTRLVRLTRDQTFAELLVERGVLSPSAAQRSAHRHVLLQALGGGDDVVAEIAAVDVWRGDTFLVCSDGLTSFVTDDEIQRLLAHEFDLHRAANALVSLARERGEADITVVLARVGGGALDWPTRSHDEEPLPRTLRPFDFSRHESLAEGDDPKTVVRVARPAPRASLWSRIVGRLRG